MASLAIGAGASLLSGIVGGKGASRAAKVQAQAYQAGIDEQRRQFNVTQQNEQPYITAGTGALSSVGDFLGLNGNDAQATALAGLRGSSGFDALANQQDDAVLQNASATGGLRGGNTENSLANARTNLFQQLVQQQLGNLGNLASMGSGAVGQLGQFGQNTANSISTLLAQQGGANAQAAGAPYAALQGVLNQLGSMKFGGGGGVADKTTGSGFTFPGLQGLGW